MKRDFECLLCNKFLPNYSLIIYYAIIIHLIWGITMIATGEVFHTTAIDANLTGISANPYVIGIFFIAVAIVAALPLWLRIDSFTALLLSLPQQYTLILSSVGALMAIIESHFADGVTRPRAFILIDQCAIIVATALHTVAILEKYVGFKNIKSALGAVAIATALQAVAMFNSIKNILSRKRA